MPLNEDAGLIAGSARASARDPIRSGPVPLNGCRVAGAAASTGASASFRNGSE